MIYPPRNAAYELERLAAKLEAAEKAVTEAYQRGYATGQEEIAAELEFAKKEITNLHNDIDAWMDKCDALRVKLETAEKERESWKGLAQQFGNELDTVRARIEEAEKEVAHIKEVEFPRKARAVAVGWETKCALLEQERDALLARIEAMERQEPVDLNYIELMNSAQKIVESYVYFRRFIASTPLENDIAVWMADFVFAQLGAKGE